MSNSVENQSKKELNIILFLFLVFSIISYIITSYNYLNLIISDNPFYTTFPVKTIFLFIGCLLGVFFTVSILLWKKIGFIGVSIITFISFGINMSFEQITLSQSMYGIYGLIILFFLMQIKKNGISAWAHIYKYENSLNKNNISALSDDLTKLGELKEKGLLTEEEFNEQKKKLLKQ